MLQGLFLLLLLFMGLFLRKHFTWNKKDYSYHQTSAQWLHNGIICNISYIVSILYTISIPNVSNLPRLLVFSMVCFDPAGNYLWLDHASPDRGHWDGIKPLQGWLSRSWVSAKPLAESSALLTWASLAELGLVPWQPESCHRQRVCDLGETSSAAGEEELTPHSLALCSHLATNFPSPWEHEITPCETTQHPQYLTLHSIPNREHFIPSLAWELREAGYQFQLSWHIKSSRKQNLRKDSRCQTFYLLHVVQFSS